MATIPHSSLTTADLHEPKGISTANSGEVYVSDGTGSGQWTTTKTGHGLYQDNSTEQSFGTTPSKVSIDGLGSNTIESYLPLDIRSSGTLWDTDNDRLTPVAVGDAYSLRLDLPITSRSATNYLILTFDIGSNNSAITVPILTKRIEVDRAAPFDESIELSVFVGSTFIANGGQIFIETDTGSIGVTGPQLFIARVHGESV